MNSTENRVSLSLYNPPRRAGERIGQYIDRVYSYLNNFHLEGQMPEVEKLDHLTRIIYTHLPKEVIPSIYTATSKKEIKAAVEIAAKTYTAVNLTPEKIAAEKLPGKSGYATSVPTAAVTAVTPVEADKESPQKNPPAKHARGIVGGEGWEESKGSF